MTTSSIEKEFDEQLPKLYKYNFFNGVESYTTCGEEVKSFYRQKINEKISNALKGFVGRLRGDLMFIEKWDKIDDILSLRLVKELDNFKK